MQQPEERSYEGFSLFDDIESEELRAHNRGATLRNILNMHQQGKKVSAAGTLKAMGYFSAIPLDERKAAMSKCAELLVSDGLIKGGSHVKTQ